MKKLWLWKNFVDGRPEYWAFDNPYPCKLGGGDPLTLGEPCGYAIVKESTQGRFDVSEAEVIAAIKRVTSRPEATVIEALRRIARGYENGQGFSGTDCAEIAAEALKGITPQERSTE